MVDFNQSAFTKGKYIMDNVAAVKEIIFNLQERGITGNIIKFDFLKAFDMVD